MAGDHGRDGIRVNCIAPGLVYTPMVAPRMDDDLRQIRREAGVLGTEGTAWDIGWAAVYLASDEARWVTGVVLPVDAGLLVTTPVTYNRLGQPAARRPRGAVGDVAGSTGPEGQGEGNVGVGVARLLRRGRRLTEAPGRQALGMAVKPEQPADVVAEDPAPVFRGQAGNVVEPLDRPWPPLRRRRRGRSRCR